MKKKKVWGIWDREQGEWAQLEFWETREFVLRSRIIGYEQEIRPCYLPSPLPKKAGKEKDGK